MMRRTVRLIGIIISVAGLALTFYSVNHPYAGVFYSYQAAGAIFLLTGFITLVIGTAIPEERRHSLLRETGKNQATREDKTGLIEAASKCRYRVDTQYCKAVIEDEEGEEVREQSCTNRPSELASAVTCVPRKTRVTSAATALTSPKTRQLLRKPCRTISIRKLRCRQRIERLAGLLAEGKIGERSYLASTRALEQKMERLQKLTEDYRKTL